MLGMTISLCACMATGNVGDKGRSGSNNSQSRNQTNADGTPPTPEPGLTPRQRILKAIQQLEIGQADIAKVELDEYLISTPDSSRAKQLLKQITTPASEFYPNDFFTVDLAFGQSISTLAQHYLGNALEFYALAKYNAIENPSRINTGSKIKIPLTVHAKSVREKDTQLAIKKEQQSNNSNKETVEQQTTVSPENSLPSTFEEESEQAQVESVPESLETLKIKIAESNRAGNFEQSIELFESLKAMDDELGGDTLVLASAALVGRADNIVETEPATASVMYSQAADFMQKNGDDVAAFDYYKLAYDTDNSNNDAQQKMLQLQQQIVDKYHREASVAFRQQRIDEAIEKWNVVLHVDPFNTNVSAYRSQAIELQERLKALNN